MASEIKAELLKIPPVTRFLCASQLAVSLPVILQILSPYQLVFVWQLVTQRFEVRASPEAGYPCVCIYILKEPSLDMEVIYKFLFGW